MVGVFLDRDGTVIEDLHYPKDAERVKLIPRAVEGLKLMQEKGYRLFIVSNQSGVGRGIITPEQFEAVHKRVEQLLREAGVEISAYYYCKHAPEAGCGCRKPNTGLIPKRFEGREIDWSRSYVVGDRESDLVLGNNMRSGTFLVETGKGHSTLALLQTGSPFCEYKVVPDLLALADKIPVPGTYQPSQSQTVSSESGDL